MWWFDDNVYQVMAGWGAVMAAVGVWTVVWQVRKAAKELSMSVDFMATELRMYLVDHGTDARFNAHD